MKAVCHIVLFLLISSSVFSQYYLRGEVKDESGNSLQNVTIINIRTGYVYRSGTLGSFGILTNQQIDTFSFYLDGFRPERAVANADQYLSVKMKLLPSSVINIRRDKLSSLIRNMRRDEQRTWFTGDETYASIIENRFVNAQRFPNTGMSLNVDRASYSNIRRFITLNSMVPPDAVRIEEMLNYFNLDYEEPKGDDLFSIKTTLTTCPWNPASRLYYIQQSARKLNLDTLPPNNLVFLIDVSGSMDMTNRMPLLKSAFRLLVSNLRAKDSVAIVVYGGYSGVMLNTVSGAEKDTILKTIDQLTPAGATPGESGIKLAYSVARNHFIKGGNNRVILATDGDFNVGVKSEDELDELISRQSESGVYLTCLGVGMGNYKDSKIQTLARRGNGNFAYLDNFKEAEKVLMKEFTQTLYAVADDVYMDVGFNPDYVKEYRLVGYDNKVGALNDSLAVIEGGEIGSGQSLISVFEIIPQDDKTDTTGKLPPGKFAEIQLQYKKPNQKDVLKFSWSSPAVITPFSKSEKCYRFTAAVALFGSMLRSSQFTRNLTWNEVVNLAAATSNPADLLQKEFVSIVQHAKTLYARTKKKKGRSEEN
ncbi:MAG: von Willebrand factor type A domain-containing protein [Chitinophagaceae bacterium]|nr:von Willebrand factor type A domain-containing protein [Chitinophagaceae bacterium]